MTRSQLTSIASRIKAQAPGAEQAVNELTNAERIEVRQLALAMGAKALPRNLYYNYETQEWIEGPDFPSTKQVTK